MIFKHPDLQLSEGMPYCDWGIAKQAGKLHEKVKNINPSSAGLAQSVWNKSHIPLLRGMQHGMIKRAIASGLYHTFNRKYDMSKSNIFKITLLVFLLSEIIIGFKNAPQPGMNIVAAMKAKPAEFQQVDQKENPLDSTIEYLEYKDEVIKKIRQNELRISNLKEKKNVGEMGIGDDYISPLNELEQRNIKLSSRIRQYNEGTPQNWENIKHQLNMDINEIDKTIYLMAEISLSEN